MPRLGDLERAIMEVLWEAATPLTAKAICDALERRAWADRSLAVTTVLTVLSRLERKDMVTRRRDDRAHTYVAAATREDHVAELMREALGTAGDRDAALARFVGAATPQEADVLRRALRTLRRSR
jgi:predicted transcriptional regulator